MESEILSTTNNQLMVKVLVSRIVNKLIKNSSDRKDVFHDICILLKTAYEKNYVEQGKLLAWAAAIAKNMCTDYYRQMKKKRKLLQDYKCFYSRTEMMEMDPLVIRREILDDFIADKLKKESESLSLEILKLYYINFETNKKSIARKLNVSYKKVSRVINNFNKEMQELEANTDVYTYLE